MLEIDPMTYNSADLMVVKQLLYRFREIEDTEWKEGYAPSVLKFINQFQISKAQYEEILQTTLQEEYSFDLQVQLAKYQLIKRQHPSSSIQRFLGRFGF